MRLTLSSLGVAALLWALSAAADNAQATSQQLQALEKKLEQLQQRVARKQRALSASERAMREAEKSLSRVKRQQLRTADEVDALNQRIAELDKQHRQLNQTRQRYRGLLDEQLKQAWVLNRESPLKLLLNQESPDQISRMLVWYRHTQAAGQQRLTQFLETLDAIADNREQQQRNQLMLARRQQQLQAEINAVRDAQAQRRLALTQLKQELARDSSEAERARRQRDELQALLQELEGINDIPVPDNFQPIGTLKGVLPWPVDGARLNAFGGRRASSLNWQGIQLAAAPGSSVKAIHHGRVVFADWLRGAGLLIIIDHGDGYLSLYGNNQSLLHDVGDWVSSGQNIATLGEQGDSRNLYFELRRGRKALDPVAWCRS